MGLTISSACLFAAGDAGVPGWERPPIPFPQNLGCPFQATWRAGRRFEGAIQHSIW